MKSLIALLALIITADTLAGTKAVEGSTTGNYYNEIWEKFFEEEITVYVDSEADVYIRAGETNTAAGFVKNKDYRALIDALKKSQKWAETAKAEQLETTKLIADFTTPYKSATQGIAVHFFAASAGAQTDVILHVRDFDNQFKDVKLYLKPHQVEALIAVLERVPETYQALKAGTGKADRLLQ